MNQPKLTVIVPTYTISEQLCIMASQNALIWKQQADELIISEDAQYCRSLARIPDIYLLHPNLGPCENMNLAWKLALVQGADYVAIADSDVTWASGSLRDMCIPGKVTIPINNQHPDMHLVAPMVVVPATVAAERGLYECLGHRNEGFDYRLQQRVRDILETVESCKIDHIGSASRAYIHGSYPWLINDSEYWVKNSPVRANKV